METETFWIDLMFLKAITAGGRAALMDEEEKILDQWLEFVWGDRSLKTTWNTSHQYSGICEITGAHSDQLVAIIVSP